MRAATADVVAASKLIETFGAAVRVQVAAPEFSKFVADDSARVKIGKVE
ncbi:hypothetical protein [Bradyrhizobium sp. CER78]|nr:hypothetical protein [Bradyrhizobium sp. CER78]MDH2383846.1 hypothetical protein [Bradyrhizobium sp. CER78]